jgi:hypothetical protein
MQQGEWRIMNFADSIVKLRSEFGYQEEPATSQGKAFLESSIKKSSGE